MVNSATWGKQKRTEKWTATDTEVFYDVRLPLLSSLAGTDEVRTGSPTIRNGL
jgi:hypothetical protein